MVTTRYIAVFVLLLALSVLLCRPSPAKAGDALEGRHASKTDSLEKVIAEQAVSDSLLMDAYRLLGWEQRSTDIMSAYHNTQMALEYAKKIDCATCQGTIMANLGHIYWRKGKITEAFDHLLDARQIAEEIDNELAYGRTLNHLGILFSGQGHYDQALEHYLEAYRVYARTDSISQQARVLNNMGLVYTNQGDLDQAEELHLEAYEINQSLGDERRMGYSLHNLGSVFKKRGEFDKALDHYERSLEVLVEFDDIRDLAIVVRSMGILHLEKKEFQEAIRYLHDARDLNQQAGDERSLARVMLYLGEAYAALRDYDRAQNFIAQSRQIADRLDLPAIERDAYLQLSRMMADMHSYQLAYQYQQKYLELEDSIQDEESRRRVIELQMMYDRERKASEIDLLQKSNEIAELNLEKQRLFQRMLIVFIVLILLILFAIYYRFREARRTNRVLESQKAEIMDSNHKLKELNNKLIEEKRKVEELNAKLQDSESHLKEVNKTKDKFFSIISHDLRNPFASIVSFSRILKRDIQDLSREELQELARELDKSVLKINSLLENLLQWSRTQTGKIKFNPEFFDLGSVVTETINLFSAAAREKDVEIIDNAGDYTVYGDLNMTQTIIRNLLSNALKYSNPGGQVEIAAHKTNGFAEVAVKDQGVGIAEADQKKLFRIDSLFSTYGTYDEKGSGLGLLLCKEFSTRQGGQIFVDSKKGEGSVFRFTIPLEPTGEA